jgi:hypothetical protein
MCQQREMKVLHRAQDTLGFLGTRQIDRADHHVKLL